MIQMSSSNIYLNFLVVVVDLTSITTTRILSIVFDSSGNQIVQQIVM